MKEPDTVAIVFTKNQPPYLAGEGGRRSPKDALTLVSLGVAKFVDPPPGLDEDGKPLKERHPPKKKRAAAKKKAPAKGKAKAKPKAKPKAKR